MHTFTHTFTHTHFCNRGEQSSRLRVRTTQSIGSGCLDQASMEVGEAGGRRREQRTGGIRGTSTISAVSF